MLGIDGECDVCVCVCVDVSRAVRCVLPVRQGLLHASRADRIVKTGHVRITVTAKDVRGRIKVRLVIPVSSITITQDNSETPFYVVMRPSAL